MNEAVQELAGEQECIWLYLGQVSEVAGQSEVQLLRLVVGDDPGKDRVLVQVIVCATLKTQQKHQYRTRWT